MQLNLSPNAGATTFPYGITTSQDNGDISVLNTPKTFGIVPSVAYVELTTQTSGTYNGKVYGEFTLPATATVRNIRFYVLGAALGSGSIGNSELSIVTAGTAIPNTGNIFTTFSLTANSNGALQEMNMAGTANYNLLHNVPLFSTIYYNSDSAYSIAADSQLIMEIEYYFLNAKTN